MELSSAIRIGGTTGDAASAFSPTDVDQLHLWLKGDAGVTLVGGKVSNWADQSGNGNDFFQDNASLRPTVAAAAINSLDAIEFVRASTQWLKCNTLTAYGGYGKPNTTFIVFKLDLDNVGQSLIYASRDDVVKTFNVLSYDGTRGLYGGLTNLPSADREWRMHSRDITVPHLVTVHTDTTGDFLYARENGVLFQDRIETNVGVVLNLQYCSVGMATENNYAWSDQAFDGKIAEILVYSRALSPREISLVEGYLMDRYAIGHPWTDQSYRQPPVSVAVPVWGLYNTPYYADGWVGTILADASPGNLLIYLPYAVSEGLGRGIVIRRTDNSQYAVTVLDAGGKKIEGSTDPYPITGNSWARFENDGTDWWAVAKGAIAAARPVLTANRTYYVRTDGNDSNDGLTNTAGGAFLTIQKGVDVAKTFDLNGYVITIQVADGTYTGQVSVDGGWVGATLNSPGLQIKGNEATPSNVLITTTNTCITVFGNPHAPIYVSGVKLASSAGYGLWAHDYGYIQANYLEFGACIIDIHASNLSRITMSGNYSVAGARTYHIVVGELSVVIAANLTVTLVSTPTFNTWAFVNKGGHLNVQGCTFTGSGTGRRYQVHTNAQIETNNAGETYLPGNVLGIRTTGGTYGPDSGTLTTVVYNAGDYTSDSGTWTVEAGDMSVFEYMIVGNSMFMNVVLQGTSISGTPSTLRVKIPAGRLAAWGITATAFAIISGTMTAAYVWTGTGYEYIGINLWSGTWTAGTDNRNVYFQCWLRIT